ncbi:MAG: hypothetical protein ETSY1_36960 [Candidatus Entotheonella factor]|uniref:DUF4058 domain-containing protein n=1 Tax=Entotheonella factor TaxID=1429438 RepID=W4L7B1_ENTF1|nr:MAG: hypothetical protein ETSY1_36960 [Candidatus Entotheonella factor]
MDPYLEGYLWPDVHHRLATQISDQLMPLVRPRYVARIEIQVVADDTPEAEIGIMYPDVEIVRPRPPAATSQASPSEARAAGTAMMTPTSLSVPLLEVEVRLATVEIRDTAENQLVSSIEILSPVNKREPGLSKYRDKQRRLREAHVHILDIDLLRRGQRPLAHPRIPAHAYRVTLSRAGESVADVWAIPLQEPLPVVPVPLRAPDEDVPLDLSLALATIYDRAAYDLSLNYNEPPPPPPLSDEAQAWVRRQVDLHASS